MRVSLILLSLLSACFRDETVSGQTDVTDVWVLQTHNEVPAITRITIQFPEEGRIAGQAPCNRYFGTQTLPLPWFKASNIGATKMACPDLALESQYFGLLETITTAEVAGGTLILRGDSGETLVFKKN